MALNVENLQKQYSDLDNRETRWDEACETCELPKLAHTVDAICKKDPNLELDAHWNAFRRMMEPIKEGYKGNMGNMKVENKKCLDDITINNVEIQTKDQSTLEAKEAKQKELQNLFQYFQKGFLSQLLINHLKEEASLFNSLNITEFITIA